jgi:hypothetical protein
MRSKSRSRQSGWVLRSVLPWCLAAGVLVTSAADATQNPQEQLLKRRSLIDGNIAALPLAPARLSLIERSLRTVSGTEVKGPLVPVGNRISAELAYAQDADFLPPAPLSAFGRPFIGPPVSRHFSQLHADGTTDWTGRGAVAPDAGRGMTSPVAIPVLTAAHPDGTTPSLQRAVSLASTTPAPVEPEVIAMPAGFAPEPGTVPLEEQGRDGSAHPNYAALIDPEEMSREQRCLAEAVYFEARSEPPAGQAAVAQVVLNRVKSGLYPRSVCGVVYQNRNRYKACQFTFACEGKSLRITEPGPWKQAVKVARDVTDGTTYLSKVGNALNYHADYVKPYWARSLHRNDRIGRHIFYSLRTGQR